jgi:uncharacterized coiled-coil protein SlyX
MSDESIRLLITVIPAAGTLLFTARYVWQLQQAVTARFEHLLQVLREDIVGLERRNAAQDVTIIRLEGQLSVERDARRADNHQHNEAMNAMTETVASLRRQLAQFTPPYGTPPTIKENP